MLTSVEGIYENGVVRLLEQLPGVARARVVVTVLPDAPSSWLQPSSQPVPASPENREADTEAPTGDTVADMYQPRTELGRKLLELRRAHVQAGGKLLNWDEIDRVNPRIKQGGRHYFDSSSVSEAEEARRKPFLRIDVAASRRSAKVRHIELFATLQVIGPQSDMIDTHDRISQKVMLRWGFRRPTSEFIRAAL